MTTFEKNYFMTSRPNILDNNKLRKVQIDAYIELCNHFILKKAKEHAVVILPTGAGKTGVMALAPYNISQGRVLIITPQLVIKDHVLDSLDPSSKENFWLKQEIFSEFIDLPKVVEYDKETFIEELDESNIVILNIHKLSAHSRNSLLDKVNRDYFDMIIIDEAHHSPANTWQNALNYFSDAKVIKVTGTPFRTDRQEIEGKIVINYRLGKAMHDGIVKTLSNFQLIPEKVELTLDNDESQTYSLEELKLMKIRDTDFITRSVAMSTACNQQIVDASLVQLYKRRDNSDIPHKIIAVCCSIDHAKSVKKLYEQRNLSTVIVHSKQPKKEKIESLRMIESHQADIVIHVAMLGEGYDHPFLSVAAIFRPYRSLAPYAQFIGRILRRVPNAKNPLDNIGIVIAHRDLDLDPLWKEYMEEQEYCDVLESVKKSEPGEKKLDSKLKNIRKEELGEVSFAGEIITKEEYYEYTNAAKEYELYEQSVQEKANKLREIFPDKTEKELNKLARMETTQPNFNPLFKNPKKYRTKLREEFNEKVQFDIPAELIQKYGFKKEGTDFKKLPVKKESRWVLSKGDNAAIIALYLNDSLKKLYGERNQWTIYDYLNATETLDSLVFHLNKLISSLKEG
ncbi:RNA helicase [Niallia circulans]|uniref:RNA helicase n=1 Tax=Niallia circulans TaxID=1397 RepID=A0A0J1L218_NIACI|nr:DEAD/DEAH box helicase family protein [Niallia circulans]KLV23040.1 RNA helicase [Niallia circulans]